METINVQAMTVEIAKLELKPGDVLIVRVPTDWQDMAKRLRDALAATLPPGIPIIVCPSEVGFLLVSNKQDAQTNQD